MKKYQNLLILVNYILILIVLFLPNSILVWGYGGLFIVLLLTYFIGDNKEEKFLSKIKYNYLAYVLSFFIFRNYSRLSGEIQFLRMDFSRLIVVIGAIMFTYILLRIDRLSKIRNSVVE